MPDVVTPVLPADELLQALALLDETLSQVRRAAGGGGSPEFDKLLLGHLRSLRALLGGESATLVEDVVEAAQRVLDAAEPSAPLLMLEMSQRTLAARLQRMAGTQLHSNAA